MCFSFDSGTTMSSLPNEIPALKARVKPSAIMRSQKMTVSFWPQWRYTTSMTLVISFLVSRWLITRNGTFLCFGRIRSEEHTSELQYLMRHSYAVFYLPKTTNMISITNEHDVRTLITSHTTILT